MDDLVQWLGGQLGVDAARAVAACEGGKGLWREEDPERYPGRIVDERGELVVYDSGAPSEGQGAHIAEHDPARVLREIDAKRQMLSTIVEGVAAFDGMDPMTTVIDADVGDDLLKLLALPYADRPGYREEWRP